MMSSGVFGHAEVGLHHWPDSLLLEFFRLSKCQDGGNECSKGKSRQDNVHNLTKIHAVMVDHFLK